MKKYPVLFFLIVIAGFMFFAWKENRGNLIVSDSTKIKESLSEQVINSKESQHIGDSPPQKQTLEFKDNKNEEAGVGLTAGNFESFVLKCFQGEKCLFSENPLRMYREFKVSGNSRAIDSLLSFMRSQLKHPEFREKYKDTLKQMIDDFYSPEEKQFQQAAYYDYLGDYQKSLDLYLDLQKKNSNDPNLREAPNLNIANVLYKMRRFKEALSYYQAALDDYLSGRTKADPSPVSFIEERIDEIKRM